QWGGATAAWGGRCIPFDAIDFEKRSWVPHSGWPITKAQLDPFYARALALCEAGEYKFFTEETFPEKQREMIAGFDGPDVVSNRMERWGPPTHFGKRYARDLESASNVTVLFHANCQRIQLHSEGQRVEQITVASFERNEFFVRARFFVLACGGLENTRLLLASNDVMKTGIGNHSDKLGRYYMSHLFGALAMAKLRDNGGSFIFDLERDREQVYCRRRFWITSGAQKKNEILNAIAFFFRPPLGRAVHRNALFSSAYLAKFFLTTFKRNSPSKAAAILRENRAALLAHLKIVAADAPHLVPEVAAIVKNRWFARRRLPFVLPRKSHNHYCLYYQSEHAPNPESRVMLHSEKDFFGMPRLLVKIKFSEMDVESVLRAHRLIRDQFAATKTGELVYDEAALREDVRHEIQEFNSSAHQLGTTRMSASPTDGVVDADCRVHGAQNLFVAGSSVFPTSGHANPTLTIVALAVRLADYLKASLRE
ncbi:MAG TPA: GMC family oxidoreductase, partial [Verrucomicrobiae bacterium]|nr:GMC family oxidoreductase [Verrucomicrobiae bacterium]